MSLGRHLLADLWGCTHAAADDLAALEALALDAVRATGAEVLGWRSHRFEPQGVTVMVLVAESHLALHTWPEHGYIAFDYFTCGDRVAPEGALRVVCEALRPSRVEQREIARGGEAL